MSDLSDELKKRLSPPNFRQVMCCASCAYRAEDGECGLHPKVTDGFEHRHDCEVRPETLCDDYETIF